MARIRSIKPGFFANEGLSEVSELAQILAGGLICYADDDGYFDANPLLIKAAVFPLRRNVQEEQIVALLPELSRIGYCRFGTGPDGKRYGHVVKFKDHQKVSHPSPSKIKEMGVVWEVSRKTPEASLKPTEVLRPELNRIELNRTEKEKNLKPSARKARSAATQVSLATGESKHHRIVGMVAEAWNEHNPGATCPIGPADVRQVKLLLEKTTGWPDTNYAQCLTNLYATEGFPRSELPMNFLPRLPSYFSGPKDRYNRELGAATYVNKGQQRQDAANDAIQTALARISGEDAGEPEGSVSLPGYDAGNSGDLLAGNGHAGSRSRAATAGVGHSQVIEGVQDVPINRRDPRQGTNGRK